MCPRKEVKFQETWKGSNVLYLDNSALMCTDEIRRIFTQVLGAKVDELYRWAPVAKRVIYHLYVLLRVTATSRDVSVVVVVWKVTAWGSVCKQLGTWNRELDPRLSVCAIIDSDWQVWRSTMIDWVRLGTTEITFKIVGRVDCEWGEYVTSAELY